MISARPAVTQEQNNFFFHTPSFVFRNNPQDVRLFQIDGKENESAKIFFTRNNESIDSLGRSPFGGFILENSVRRDTIFKLLAEIESWCNQNNVHEILIRNCPDIYDPAGTSFILDALLQANFHVTKTELLQFISIDDGSADRLNRNRKRKLNECIGAGFQFMPLGLDCIEDAYGIFVECRTDKNYPVTMSLMDFRNAFDKFPDQYFLFGVKAGENLIAASVCIKVNDRILYDFFHGDRLSGRKLSPLTLLVTGLIEFCQKHGFQLLDLGVSTDNNGINKGLTQFKNSFGAKTSQKLTLSKRLNL